MKRTLTPWLFNGKDSDTFTTIQTNALFAIANQCPLLGDYALRVLVAKGTVRHAFSTASLPLGLYHYKVLSGDGLLGDGKLTIVR